RRLSLPPLAPTPTSSLSLHDALPIYEVDLVGCLVVCDPGADVLDQFPGQLIPRYGCCGGLDDGMHRFAHFRIGYADHGDIEDRRSEEHTSELQSRFDLVCRLLLEKKK